MEFYSELSKYYDEVFPAGEAQVEFISDCFGKPPRSILDVACGSGGYSVKLAKRGYHVTSVDMDEEMVKEVKAKFEAEGLHGEAFQCDMRDLGKAVQGKFDLLFCIGNSLVHLTNPDEIRDVLKQMGSKLEKGGRLILQILNYDRIMKLDIKELPVIENKAKGIKFIRKYTYHEETGLLDFHTVLTARKGSEEKKFENTVVLFPLMKEQLGKMLEEADFGQIQFYGDFERRPYTFDSFMLVVQAVKSGSA